MQDEPRVMLFQAASIYGEECMTYVEGGRERENKCYQCWVKLTLSRVGERLIDGETILS